MGFSAYTFPHDEGNGGGSRHKVRAVKDMIVGKVRWDSPALSAISTEDVKLICSAKTMKQEQHLEDSVAEEEEELMLHHARSQRR